MPDRTEAAEVAIVGCGPGGAVLGYLLARSGVDVALLEQAATFDREFRGFGWNPGVVRLFDEMDVLEDVLDLAHETVTEGGFTLGGETVTVLDFEALDTDYPYALMMEQPALLECLVEHARAYDDFSFHPATTVTDLRVDDAGVVRGVLARDREADEEVAIEASCVVGADGRYSTVRRCADIDPGRFDSPIQLVWFKLPGGPVEATTQGRFDTEGILGYFGLGGGELQIGYPIRDGDWPAIREAGFDAFRDRIAAIDPRLGPVIDDHLAGFEDTTLLDVGPGVADTWTRDGLLLLGDAAHTASPLGAQGNPLAVEDAVVVHDLLATALADSNAAAKTDVETDTGRESPDPLPAATLRPFEDRRRPPVEDVIARQRRAAASTAFWLDYGRYVPISLVRLAARAASWAVSRSRLVRRPIETFALGDQSVSVNRSHFTD